MKLYGLLRKVMKESPILTEEGEKEMKVRKIKKDGWVGKEVMIVKPYKRFSNFKKAVKQAVRAVFDGYDDLLWIVVSAFDLGYRRVGEESQVLSLSNDAIKEFKGMGEMTLGEVIDKFGEVSFSWGGKDWKQGIDVKFDDLSSRIYVYDMWRDEE